MTQTSGRYVTARTDYFVPPSNRFAFSRNTMTSRPNRGRYDALAALDPHISALRAWYLPNARVLDVERAFGPSPSLLDLCIGAVSRVTP